MSRAKEAGDAAGQATDLLRLTSLRAFAALAVFLHHTQTYNNWLWHDRYFRYGGLGVSFFFVLSGFVLTWAWRPGDHYKLFYVRRFARVWPLHVAALVMAVAVLHPTITLDIALANLLLIQAWMPNLNSINDVSWSLSVEAFFYALAPLIIATGNRMRRSAFIATAAFVITISCAARVMWAISGDSDNLYLYMQPALRLGEFVAGVVAAVLIRGGWLPRIPVTPVLAVVIAALLGFGANRSDVPRVIAEVAMLPIFAVLIAAAASADLRGVRGVLQHRVLTYAGELSFAFYLVHVLVLQMATDLVSSVPPKPVGACYTLGALLVTGCLGAVLHHLVEKPAQRRIVAAAHTRLPVPSLR